MDLKIKMRLESIKETEEVIKLIGEIEKEYSCNCTLLDVEIG